MVHRFTLVHAAFFLMSAVMAQADRIFDPFQGQQQQGPSGPIAAVEFISMEHDFGQIYQGSENPHVFKFKNTGDVPLIISSASGSCGCTVPYYAKVPILPGEESEIHIVYKPGKQKGEQSKTATIVANTSPAEIQLRITAEVIEVDSVAAPTIFEMLDEQDKYRIAVENVDPGCFVIFPNPASNEIRLDLKEHIGRSADVRIRDTTGKEMISTRIAAINSEASRLDIEDLPSGIYIATIEVEGGAPMSQCFVVSE